MEMHNKIRSTVAQGLETRGAPGPQPPAFDMLEMTWDDELEQVAQRWADQCNYGHDEARQVERFSVGQNINYGSRVWKEQNETRNSIETGINNWYNEVAFYDKTQVKKYM